LNLLLLDEIIVDYRTFNTKVFREDA